MVQFTPTHARVLPTDPVYQTEKQLVFDSPLCGSFLGLVVSLWADAVPPAGLTNADTCLLTGFQDALLPKSFFRFMPKCSLAVSTIALSIRASRTLSASAASNSRMRALMA